MIKNLFRPSHLLDPWRDNFVTTLRLRNISGSRIGDALAQVDEHCTESGDTPEEAFGDLWPMGLTWPNLPSRSTWHGA